MTIPSFLYEPLGRVLCEPGGLKQLGALAKGLGGTRALLVTDPGLEKTDHPQRAERFLRGAGLTVAVFDGVKENPSDREVAEGAAAAKVHQADIIVAVGGGSAMDCAKGINFIFTNGGVMADYQGHGKATKPMLASIGVPTTSGTGSEAQSYALITNESTHMKMACGDKKAAFRISILDPELTLTQPRYVTAVTGIDALAHAVESYVCTRSNPISRTLSQAAFEYLEPNFETVLSQPDNLAARAGMQVGAHLAGMAIESAMLGVCHSCANPLTAHYGLTHGAAIALLLPHVIRFNASHAGEMYAKLAGSAEQLSTRLTNLAKVAGLPVSMKETGVSESILPLLADEAARQWTAKFNPRPVTDRDCLQIYQAAW